MPQPEILKKAIFYKTLKNYIDPKQNLILGGDFNMVEDILLDKNEETQT